MARQGTKEAFETHDKPVGWAVVGLGMGRWHARYVAKSPGLKLVGLCDASREAIARCAEEFPGAAHFTAIDELLADGRVQGVSLVLPHNQHAPVALRCLNAGRHVVLDKPFCLSVADGKKMIAAARAKRRLLSVFHNRRWDADYVAIQRLVDKGTIGKVRYIESRIVGAGRMGAGSWRAERRQMGGLLYDWGAHLIDQSLLLIKSRPVSVCGLMQRDIPATKDSDIEDRMQATIRFEDGAAAVVAWFTNSPAPAPRFVIEGERGGIRVDPSVHSSSRERNVGGVDLYLPGRKKGQIVKKTVPYPKTAEWVSLYRNVGRALAGKEALAVRPEQALRHVAINEAAYESVRTGKVVPLPKDLF